MPSLSRNSEPRWRSAGQQRRARFAAPGTVRQNALTRESPEESEHV